MTGSIIRAFVTLLFAVVMAQQARRAPALSHRQRAFGIAAGVFGLFTLLNGLQIVGVELNITLSIVIRVIACLLILLSLVFLYMAWKGGEMRAQIERAQQAINQERKRRQR